jgi:TerC family integral membrane protein
MNHPALWIVFGVVVVLMLALDLGVFHREAREISTRSALKWTAFWVALGMAFNLLVLATRGPAEAGAYLTCYLTEEALSVDNIFVFVVIFRYFSVPSALQHRVLFWGILGALAMRALFIGAGVGLIQHFEWLTYVLGGFLIVTGAKLGFEQEKEVHPEKNPVLRMAQRFVPVTTHFEGPRFFVTREGRRFATPLFLALIAIETTDVVFAADSVPAALAITTDPFILYTSNVFAILGLRSMYFAVSGFMRYLRYLQQGLALILVFVGVKMLVAHRFPIATPWALGIVVGILTAAVIASLLNPPKSE